MPEGPEIRRAADQLQDALTTSVVDDVYFAFDHLKPHAQRLRGRAVTSVETRGKAMLLRFEVPLIVYTHNQLYGRCMIRDRDDYPETRRQLRLAIHNAERSALLYSASEIQVLTPRQLSRHPFLSRLGPDVLSADLEQVLMQLHARGFHRRRLGSLLLDQRFLAGVGNYLRSEILFVARLHPARRPVDCDAQELRRLAAAALEVPRQSYRYDGVTNDLQLARALKAAGQRRSRYRHWVFARGGEACRACGTPLVEALAASRRIYHCPACQPVNGD